MSVRVEHGDCLEVLPRLVAEGLLADACVTDPPYHLASIVRRFGAEDAAPSVSEGPTGVYARSVRGFMGQKWDGGDIAFRVETWRRVYEALKPGAYLVAFSAPRTYHRMACAIEDAGFEIRDTIYDFIASDAAVDGFLASLDNAQHEAFARVLEDSAFGGMLGWAFGTGFPKSHDVERAIATSACRAEGRHFARTIPPQAKRKPGDHVCESTPESELWRGWGTAAKPALEPIVVARKPLIGSVADNIATHGVGAINIDACRIATTEDEREAMKRVAGFNVSYANGEPGIALSGSADGSLRQTDRAQFDSSKGRWPANIVHDGSAEVLARFPRTPGQKGGLKGGEQSPRGVYNPLPPRHASTPRGDAGSSARFFYSAKAQEDDRVVSCKACDYHGLGKPACEREDCDLASHPTVKPPELMQWLVRMVTPPGGLVLDPFAGTGTTGAACQREGFSAVLIEQSAAYVADIRRRLLAIDAEAPLFAVAAE